MRRSMTPSAPTTPILRHASAGDMCWVCMRPLIWCVCERGLDPRGWRERAACRSGHDPELWFPVGPAAAAQTAAAKAVCRDCPVWAACLAEALSERSAYGIFGGLTAEERRALLR